MGEPAPVQRYFEDVGLGDEFEEPQRPTAEHVAAFFQTVRSRESNSAVTDGRFSDPTKARRIGLERPIVPGVMSTAMIMRVVTDWMGPLGRIVSLDVTFRRPVLQGDPLRCVAVVTDGGDEIDEFSPGVVSLDLSLETDAGERPVQGTARVELPRRG